MDDLVLDRFIFARRINEKSGRKIGRDDVGEELIKVRMVDTRDPDPLVFDVSYECAAGSIPP